MDRVPAEDLVLSWSEGGGTAELGCLPLCVFRAGAAQGGVKAEPGETGRGFVQWGGSKSWNLQAVRIVQE